MGAALRIHDELERPGGAGPGQSAGVDAGGQARDVKRALQHLHAAGNGRGPSLYREQVGASR